MTANAVGEASASPPSRHSRVYKSLSRATGVLLIGGAVALIWLNTEYRISEAHVTAWLVESVSDLRVVALSDRPILHFTADGMTFLGIQLALACSTALLVAPLWLISGFLFLSASRTYVRLLAACAVGTAILYAFNMVRLSVILFLYTAHGKAGLEWAHVFIGSVIMIVGACIALFVYLRIMVGRRSRKNGLPSTGSPPAPGNDNSLGGHHA
ncbi:exosortase/archaeosortase family protein [Streptomyces pathocidini]|uniref:Exosortase/archaeosortase family protein n=1 Tax=Streptomyces pathocidini TaxID=1650571 RepID=A0ABW7ULE5_9ACTN